MMRRRLDPMRRLLYGIKAETTMFTGPGLTDLDRGRSLGFMLAGERSEHA